MQLIKFLEIVINEFEKGVIVFNFEFYFAILVLTLIYLFFEKNEKSISKENQKVIKEIYNFLNNNK
jgi:hypothetical protein